MTIEDAIEMNKHEHDYNCQGFDPDEDGDYDGRYGMMADWLSELLILRKHADEQAHDLEQHKLHIVHQKVIIEQHEELINKLLAENKQLQETVIMFNNYHGEQCP